MSTRDTERLMVSGDECLSFITRAVENMTRIVVELGDELANRRPRLPGANSPFQLVTHCLGVLDYWAGRCIAGRGIQRDRDAEFTAEGRTAELAARSATAIGQARSDIAKLQPRQPLRYAPPSSWQPTDVEQSLTQSEALIHIIEELYQHLGHLELTRDILRAES